jgi:uncharacterized protein (TIGR03435 family)
MTINQTMRRSTPPVRLLSIAVGSVVFFVAVSTSVGKAQVSGGVSSPVTAGHKLEFAVASVKENKLAKSSSSNFPLDRSESYVVNGGTFSATQPLFAYILFAYKVNVSESLGGFMHSLPEWAIRDMFNIQARSEIANPTKEQMRLMVQSLLEDRFKLAVHREARQAPIFGLRLAKPGKTGPQLKQHDPNAPCSAKVSTQQVSMPAAALIGLWPADCGDGMEIRSPGTPRLLREGGRKMSMDAIASWLTGAEDFDRAILDRSGLTGNFDFILEYEPEAEHASVDANGTPIEGIGPTFRQAIGDQLGLRLKAEEGATSIFVVDHVERPSAN